MKILRIRDRSQFFFLQWDLESRFQTTLPSQCLQSLWLSLTNTCLTIRNKDPKKSDCEMSWLAILISDHSVITCDHTVPVTNPDDIHLCFLGFDDSSVCTLCSKVQGGVSAVRVHTLLLGMAKNFVHSFAISQGLYSVP